MKGLFRRTLSTAVLVAVLGARAGAGDSVAEDMDARLDTLFGAHQPYREFLIMLQTATTSHNWHALALQVAYPIRVKVGGSRMRIVSADQLAQHASAIFTPKLTAAIHQQTYETLFANANGVMIGSGEVWFSGICKDAACTDPTIKITALNP